MEIIEVALLILVIFCGLVALQVNPAALIVGAVLITGWFFFMYGEGDGEDY